jgi:glycosyltransferase involved in cell wall biosynthesis
MTSDDDRPRRLRVLAVGMILDGEDVGGAYSSFKWVEALGHCADVTLLCLQRPGRRPTAEQLPHVRVVSWPEPAILGNFERIRGQLKPQWMLLAAQARRWIARRLAAGDMFDIGHQLNPQAMRHRSPLRYFDIPYLIGPLDGSLPTPAGMASEVGESFLTRLRGLDSIRIKLDPGLRATFENASIVLGVAPYVADALSGLQLRRFETRLERAPDPMDGLPSWTAPPPDSLKLLHVGRVVRTKGLRDMVRAMPHLADLPGVSLTSAGDGPDLQACKAEAEALGVDDRVTFLGRVPREAVEQLYASHHLFAFPTFREPMGGVFFEAMRWGLPVVTADYGGPQAIVDDRSGIRLPVTNAQRFPADIAEAIRALYKDRSRLESLAAGSRRRMLELGDWNDKARDTVTLYREVLRGRHERVAAQSLHAAKPR